MRIFILAVFVSCITRSAHGQETRDTTIGTVTLPEVQVRAFEQGAKLRDIPAPVHYIDRAAFERFGPVSIVQAVNTTPGVRMEERSPGSYRFNIRGSSLRSPFGVRNVKVYYNELPFTDPGGHTYLNGLATSSFNSMEIIKGPGSSLYGAGTGGVLLVENTNAQQLPGAAAGYSTGSYGLQDIQASVIAGSKEARHYTGLHHQQGAGYRQHASYRRDVFSWTSLLRYRDSNQLKASFLYSDLYYKTPGALTLAEFLEDPKMARPPVGSNPGAVEARASIRQRSALAGASYRYRIIKNWSHNIALYGMYTNLVNPTIRNYSRSSEPHFGGRTFFSYRKTTHEYDLLFNAGIEWQEGFTNVHIHKNNGGNADSLQWLDEIHIRQKMAFLQLSIERNNWKLMAGASRNDISTIFERFQPASSGRQQINFRNEISPRISLMKRWQTGTGELNFYSGVSKGFSPPTTVELIPTGSAISTGLEPEEGINYEIGIKGTAKRQLYFDVNIFQFNLKNTIVQRRDAAGGDYFINAGKTRQRGIESYLSYNFLQLQQQKAFAWLSHTFHDFHYLEFIQLNNDYSGKHLAGVARHSLSSGIDYAYGGLTTTLTYYFSGKLPLNDANTSYSPPYHLLGARVGYTYATGKKWKLNFAAGADNLLDENYSLGPDINAFGGRYYNAAMGRNFYVMLGWRK